MPRIIVMSEPTTEREGTITLDERVASADLERGDESAQLVGRVGWAVHDADDAERPTSSPDSPGPRARPDQHPK
jgi:hypothetical protein